jgi:hypothetical protein
VSLCWEICGILMRRMLSSLLSLSIRKESCEMMFGMCFLPIVKNNFSVWCQLERKLWGFDLCGAIGSCQLPVSASDASLPNRRIVIYVIRTKKKTFPTICWKLLNEAKPSPATAMSSKYILFSYMYYTRFFSRFQ